MAKPRISCGSASVDPRTVVFTRREFLSSQELMIRPRISFEAERHGAEVVAIDCWWPEKFFLAHRALNSRVAFHELSVYELSRERLGAFDIVLFLGVLYHLRHPLLVLERVCEMTHETAVI